MRIAKWVAVGVGALLALLVLAALALTLIIDPNLYRGAIERQFATATGRPLQLTGDIELGFFPWLSLTAGAGELPGFASWREAHVGVRLVPLLRGALVVDRVRFVGLDARFVKAVDGRGNWTFATGGNTDGAAAAPWPDIAGIELRESRAEYVDVAAGTTLYVEALHLDAGPLREGEPIHLDTGFTLSSSSRPERAAVTLELRATLGPTVVLDDATLAMDLIDGRFPEGGTRVEFTSPRISFTQAGGHLEAAAWRARFAEARLHGAIDATVGESIDARCKLVLAPVSLRATLLAAGIALPPTRDAKAYSEFEANAAFRFDATGLLLEPLTLRLDDSRITGRVSRSPGEGGAIAFTLRGDTMDLGRYLKPEGAPGEPFVFPTAMLKALRAGGTLNIAVATLDGVRMKDVRLGVEGP